MSRRLPAALAAVAVLATGAALAGAGGETPADGYRVDAIFQNAGFLIPGQDVKIAGAKVGSVEDVSLTGDRKARISMLVDERFAPFRADADCTVQPQSLIGEKFVQCTPGTPAAPPLRAAGEDGTPTVPLANTSSPIDLDLVLATFRQPTTTRAALLLSAIGGGLAGRGDDLSRTVRQADPAFTEVERLLTLVNEDRETIRTLLGESDRIVAELDDRREDVAGFISGARAASAPTARRRQELQATLRELPGFLAQARPALRELRRLAQDGTPVAAELIDAAPAATRLVDRLAPFSRAARPAVQELGAAATAGRKAVKPAAPQVRRLRRLAEALAPGSPLLAEFLESSRDTGVAEGLLKFVYWGTAALSRYDSVSHILPALAQVVDTCNLQATVTAPSCDASFKASRGTTAGRRVTRTADRPSPERRTPAAPQRGQQRPQGQAPAPAVAPETPKLPGLPDVVGALPEVLDGALGGLLEKGADGRTPKALEQLQEDLRKAVGDQRSGAPQQQQALSLLDFLLGG